MIRHFSFLALSIMILSCGGGSKNVAGTDTGNPILEVAVTDTNGKPLANAKVIVYTKSVSSVSLEKVNAPCRDTLYTDRDGKVSVVTSSASVGLEVYWEDSLGVYETISKETATKTVTLLAKPLVEFPTQADLVLENNGRHLEAGSVTKIPPGLWLIRYVKFGSSDTLPPLEVRIEDAKELPEALRSLNSVATKLDSLNVVASGYVEFADYPTSPVIADQLEYACALDGHPNVNACKTNGKCRIWQWRSDWLANVDDRAVLAGTVTLDGEVLCIVFPDKAVSQRPVFYSYSEVRKEP